MSAKQSLYGRISELIKADVNTLVESAENPERMLIELVRVYTQNVREAESALATATKQLRLLEQDHAEDLRDAQQWGNKALVASSRADAFRVVGRTDGADKFDHLAKIALQHQILHEAEAQRADPQIKHQSQVVNLLRDGLNKMHSKLRELSLKRDELDARQRRAVRPPAPVQDPLKGYNILDPISDVSRFEHKIRREETRAMTLQDLEESSLDTQFESLDAMGHHSEVEMRLVTLKNSNTTPTTTPYNRY